MKSTISSKGQITVPAEVRKKLGLTAGSVVDFEVRDGGAFLRKGYRGDHPVDVVYGRLKIDRTVDEIIEEMRGPGPGKRKNKAKSKEKGEIEIVRTAVDSSVLLDVFLGDRRFGEASSRALRDAYDDGALIACEVVFAEVRAWFPSDEAFVSDIERLGIGYEPLSKEGAATAGSMWRAAKRGEKGTDPRVVADFLVGAHALRHADRLLTRDRGFYRSFFRGLKILDPSA